MDFVLKLLLFVLIVCVCDYSFFKSFLKEETRAKGDITLKMILLMFLMLFIIPLIVGFFILR